jgi:hypothetical protein
MELSMKDIGRMTCNMGTVLKLGLMVLCMKEIIKKERNTVREAIHGKMAPNMLESGKKTKLMERYVKNLTRLGYLYLGRWKKV